MPFKISPGVSVYDDNPSPILPTKVYAIVSECWWHNVATQAVCVYTNKEDADKHLEILKEKGWYASIQELAFNPDPVEFLSECKTREEFYKILKEQQDEFNRKHNLK